MTLFKGEKELREGSNVRAAGELGDEKIAEEAKNKCI